MAKAAKKAPAKKTSPAKKSKPATTANKTTKQAAPSAKPAAANKPMHFQATLEKGREGLGWTIARLPFDPHTQWRTMLRLRVRGEVAARTGGRCSFRTSLFPVPGEPGRYLLLVNNSVQKEAGLTQGSTAEFVLEPDLDPRPAELPDEFAAYLDDDAGLRAFYLSFSESMRREVGKWIVHPKGEEARLRRAAQMAERMSCALEAERDLPPLVRNAFRARPKAKAGWEKLTLLQRRQELLAIFYYQPGASREKRVAKLCDLAERRA